MTIGVDWGFHHRELLQQEKPDYLASSPEELVEIFREILYRKISNLENRSHYQ